MHILFISRSFPPTIGGIEQQNEAISRYLSAITSCNIIANKHGKALLPLFIPWAIITGIIKAKKSDAIILGDGLAACIGWFIKLIYDKPIICIVHGLDISWLNPVYQKLWVSIFFKRINHFIAVSNSTKWIAIKAGIQEKNISVIHNGIEIPKSTSRTTKIEFEKTIKVDLKDKFILLTVGRLIKRKGVAWFIDQVMTDLPKNILYLVAGSGPERERIEKLIVKKNLQEKVFLLGEIDAQTKQLAFENCDIFVQPNIPVEGDHEGFGIAMLEAGSYGKPTIASDQEGIKDAISNDKNGWRISPLDKKGFIHCILDKKKELSNNKENIESMVLNHCIRNFSWDQLALSYKTCLNDIIEADKDQTT